MDLDQPFAHSPRTLHFSSALATPASVTSERRSEVPEHPQLSIAAAPEPVLETQLRIVKPERELTPHVTDIVADLVEDYELLEPGQRERFLKDCRSEYGRKRDEIAKCFSLDDLSLTRNILEQACVEHFPTAKKLAEELLFGSAAKAQQLVRALIRPAVIDPALKVAALLETWFTRSRSFDEEDIDLLLKFAGMRKGQELMGNIESASPERYRIPLQQGPSIDIYRMTGISLGAQAIASFFAQSVTARTKEDKSGHDYPLYGHEALALAVAIEEACRIVGVKGPKIDCAWKGTIATWDLYYSHIETLAPLSRAA